VQRAVLAVPEASISAPLILSDLKLVLENNVETFSCLDESDIFDDIAVLCKVNVWSATVEIARITHP
jgi:hypothetical protein